MNARLKSAAGALMAFLTLRRVEGGTVRKILDPGKVGMTIHTGETGLAVDRLLKRWAVDIDTLSALGGNLPVSMTSETVLVRLRKKRSGQAEAEEKH